MNSNRKTRSLKRIVFVIAVSAVAAVAVPFVSPFLTDVLAQTATDTVRQKSTQGLQRTWSDQSRSK